MENHPFQLKESWYLFFSSFATLTFCFALLPSLTFSDLISNHSILPNFTATYLQLLHNNGGFLNSINGTFTASILSVSQGPPSFYSSISVIHQPSYTNIWTANGNKPISDSAKLSLTIHGLSITDGSNNVIWSTPALDSPVTALQLLETGNLVLVDNRNVSLWESFDYPSDTIVMGQSFPVGKSLDSPAGDTNMSAGDYRLTLSGEDLILQWMGQTYCKLSMQTNAYKYSHKPVSYMVVNSTGLNLYGDDGTLVIQANLNPSSFRMAKLGSEGRFTIMSFMTDKWVEEFVIPVEYCRVPAICRKMGLCGTEKGSCTCPSGFYRRNDSSGCVPKDNSLSLPTACNYSTTSISYLKLEEGMDYFANDLTAPVERGVNLSMCQDVCSKNCSCLGFFYGNYSGNCYMLRNDLGSIYNHGTEDRIGYIKTSLAASSTTVSKKKEEFPRAGMVLIPIFGFFLLIIIMVLAILWLRKTRHSKVVAARNLGRWNSSLSAPELTVATLPGLPIRYDFEELVSATENFKTNIGSGAFGTVYRGTMPDQTAVAVKKITNLGATGKKEFCTETAIIGSIRHANLVRLKGFCIHGNLRFLVYEFMNKGSLEKILFGTGSVLEWQERLKIVLGIAKGLAYLHSGCQHKIIHCDIKPENILLHEESSVKISDFGISKLLDHHGNSKLLTTMRGTRGYMAPEWLTSYGITDKSDVYSFGMVLLEIVSGRRNCSLLIQSTECGSNGPSFSSSSLEPGSVYFPAMALEMHKKRRYLELADPRLEGRVESEEAEKLVCVALCCIQIVPELRPTMAEVVAMLENQLPLGEPRVEALNFLQSFGGRLSRHAENLEGKHGRD